MSAVLALAGCQTATADSLREQFVDAGGTCTAWESRNTPGAQSSIRCDDGAWLYRFSNDAARSQFVKTELETNDDIRARTHIMLSGEDWLIIDRIAVIVEVMPSLHGIIQGRNGANP